MILNLFAGFWITCLLTCFFGSFSWLQCCYCCWTLQHHWGIIWLLFSPSQCIQMVKARRVLNVLLCIFLPLYPFEPLTHITLLFFLMCKPFLLVYTFTVDLEIAEQVMMIFLSWVIRGIAYLFPGCPETPFHLAPRGEGPTESCPHIIKNC